MNSITFQELCDHWHQVDGMVSALTVRTPFLCIHVDRTMQLQQSATVTKCDFSIHQLGALRVPFFATDAIDVIGLRYRTLAIVSHFGDPHHGHYRTALRHQSVWFVSDDGATPKLVHSLPLCFTQNTTVVWLELQGPKPESALCDSTTAMRMQPAGTSEADEATRVNAILELLKDDKHSAT